MFARAVAFRGDFAFPDRRAFHALGIVAVAFGGRAGILDRARSRSKREPLDQNFAAFFDNDNSFDSGIFRQRLLAVEQAGRAARRPQIFRAACGDNSHCAKNRAVEN